MIIYYAFAFNLKNLKIMEKKTLKTTVVIVCKNTK